MTLFVNSPTCAILQGIAGMRSAAFLTLLAAPAFAQDADPRHQLAEGNLACMSGGGRVDLTAQMLSAANWTRDDSGEEGLIYFYPANGDTTFVYMGSDGSFCLGCCCGAVCQHGGFDQRISGRCSRGCGNV